MKKILFFLLIFTLLVSISGCKKKKIDNSEKLFKTCVSKSVSNESIYKVNFKYKIFGKTKLVTKIEKEEVIISDDEEMLNYFLEYLTSSYEDLNKKYGGYNNNITKENDRIVSNTVISFDELNIKEYIKDNEVIKNYLDNENSLSLDQIVSYYEEKLDADCK